MEITRNYSHKVHGLIGSVAFTAPDGPYLLDGQPLDEASVTHLLTFALQTLQDAYAGSETADEAKASWAKKRGKLLDGTIGTRTGGDGADEFTTIARQLVRVGYKAALGAKSTEWATFTGLPDADQNAKLDELFGKNETAFRPQVEAKIAANKAERERKAKITATFTL